MKRSMSFSVALFALIVSIAAVAATINATWTNPTQNTDGSALSVAEIKQTRIEYGTCNGADFGTKAGELIVTGSATAGQLQDLTPGTWCARAYTSNVYGVESDASNVASKVVAAPKPNSPTNFSLD